MNWKNALNPFKGQNRFDIGARAQARARYWQVVLLWCGLTSASYGQAGLREQTLFYPSGEFKIQARECAPNPQRFPGPRPLLLFQHGGISGLLRNYVLRMQELCARGYHVVASSYRGEDASEGEIEIALGEVDDVLAALDFLQADRAQALGPIDFSRVGLLGFSHGALISLQAAKRRPNVFSVLVFVYGVSDLERWYHYLARTKQLGKDPVTVRTYGRGPTMDPQLFAQRQGLRDLEKLSPSLSILIVQGARDRIVPLEQAQFLANALTALGRSNTLIESPAGTHGYLIRREAMRGAEKKDSDLAWQQIYARLEAALQPTSPP